MTARYEPVESPDATTMFPYHDLEPPTLEDVYRARKVVSSHLPRTPLVRSDPLSEALDAEVYLKREDTLPTGAFKVRGGLNLVHDLDAKFSDPGLIAASTGNHGQSVAYAGREFDVPVTICVPEDANASKVAAMERLGARVVHHGSEFDEAREHAEELATTEGYRYVHSANEPRLIAGVATAGLEVVEDLPDVDALFCPVGGGSSASGYCLTVGELADAKVIGVQSGAADAAHRAWEKGHLEPGDRMETFAEGLATRTPFALTQRVLADRLDDFLLVGDEDLRAGVARMVRDEHLVIEGASAAALAGAFQRADDLAGRTVVLQVSGRNLDTAKLRAVLDEHSA
jgi:threonine dehydratase